MAELTLNNTANITGTFFLGTEAPGTLLQISDDTTVGMGFSYVLRDYVSSFKAVHAGISESFKDNNSFVGSGWLVKSVLQVPAGGTNAMTEVTFTRGSGALEQSFALVGDLTNLGSTFTLKGSSLFVEDDNNYVDINLRTPLTLTFQQTDSGKTYETQVNFYSGELNQPRTTVGSLPLGAELRTLNGSTNNLPTEWTKLTGDVLDGGSMLSLTGTFNYAPPPTPSPETQPHPLAGLTGKLTGMSSMRGVENGQGFLVETFTITNGTINTAHPFSTGVFNGNAGINQIRQDRSESPGVINLATFAFELPPGGVSSVIGVGPGIPMSTPIHLVNAVGFAGNDTIIVNSNTDTVIHAGAGNDDVRGGAGNEHIYGGSGDDTLNGNAGNDLFLVNQAEFDFTGNTVTYSSQVVLRKTIFTEELGHTIINGGAGLDTLSFAREIGNAAPLMAIKTVAATDSTVFEIKNYGGEKDFLVSIPGFKSTDYTGNFQLNQFGVAAIELNVANDLKEIYVVDVHTGKLFYKVPLSDNENFRSSFNSVSTTFYTESRSGNDLTLKAYDFGLDAPKDFPTEYFFKDFPSDVSDHPLGDIIESADGKPAYLFFNSAGIFKPSITGNTVSLSRVDEPTNSLIADVDWIDHAFFVGNQIWFKAGSDYIKGIDDANDTWTEAFLSLNPESGVITEITEIPTSSDYNPRDLFFDTYRDLARPEPAHRIGEIAIDLSVFGPRVRLRGSVELPGELQLLQLDVKPTDAQTGISFERWVVLDKFGETIADKSFNSGLGLNNGLNVRSLRPGGENGVYDGYLYFQQVNASFNLTLGGDVSAVTQESGPTVYKIPLFNITSALSSAATTLEKAPGVQAVQSYTKAQFDAKNILVIGSFVPVSAIDASQSNSNVLIAGDLSLNDADRVMTLAQIGATGVVEHKTTLSDVDSYADGVVIHAGQLYLLLESHTTDNQYVEQSAIYTPGFASGPLIIFDGSTKFDEAAKETTTAIVVSASAASDTLLNPELSLILPSAYYVAPSTLGVDKYFKSGGAGDQLGERYSNELTPHYSLWKAPADGSVGIGFENTYTGATEYVHLKGVEFLELNSPTGLVVHDIRPLYLASKNVDTLYSFSRGGYESLAYALNVSSEPSRAVGLFSDPMSRYRDQFAVFTPVSSGNEEWRYYLNGGAEKDTLHGRENVAESFSVSSLEFADWNGSYSGTLTFTKGLTSHIVPVSKADKNWSAFNKEIVDDINKLNLGVSAQRGTDSREVLISALDLAGWAVDWSPTHTSGGTLEDREIIDRGRDTLDGGADADTMIGYSGNDTYFVDNAADKVIEQNVISGGFDTVLTNTTYVLAGDTSVERLQVHQIMPGRNGNLLAEPRATPPAADGATVNLTGNNFTFELMGHDGANTITAGVLAGRTLANRIEEPEDPNIGALLLGMGGIDILNGGERNDHIFGGTGNDRLRGNAGNDKFYMGFSTADPLVAKSLLPTDYFLWNDYFDLDNLQTLTGGHDDATVPTGPTNATVGEGFDTVVIATQDYGDVLSSFNLQRTSETQIRITTVGESMLVDTTMEAIEYIEDGFLVTELLPWVSTLDAKARDAHFLGSGTSSWAWVPPSAFSDLIALNPGDSTISNSAMTSFDAGEGNDVIYGDNAGVFSTLRGGTGDDWIYSGNYLVETNSNARRYEMYGDLGKDTLTLSTAHMGGDEVLLDGGLGDDHYRVLLDNSDVTIQIVDAGGTDTLTLYASDYDVKSNPMGVHIDVLWGVDGELRVVSYQGENRNLVLSASGAAGIKNLFLVPITNELDWYLATPIGGNLVRPTAQTLTTGTLTTGVMTGTAGNDVLLALPGFRQIYDGGAGDDLIMVGNVSGNVISGGAGNNKIHQTMYVQYGSPEETIRSTISYAWAPGGSSSSVNLQHGLGYVTDAAGALIGSDRWDVGVMTDVLGGGGHDRIVGSNESNKLEGGAGNDIIYSGGNQSGQAQDHLIGGAGNDTLIDESHWFSRWHWNKHPDESLDELRGLPGSLMEGGAGNDVYVIQHNGAPPSRGFDANAASVIPTRIVERDAQGRDTGGADTIRFVTSGEGIKSHSFTQSGNVVSIQLNGDSVNVGDTILVQFLKGPTLSNGYTVTGVLPGLKPNTSVVQFTVANSIATSGQALVSEMGLDAVVEWVDAHTMAAFAGGDVSHEAMNRVSDGARAIQSYDAKTGAVLSELPVQALIDRNAMEFFDFGSADAETAGFVMPVSFNVGRNNGIELIIAGGPGSAVLFGGEGTDIIIDTSFDDILIGGNGNDNISSQIGFDIVDAGAGNDTICFRSDKQVLIGGSGADHFMITGLGAGNALIADFKPWEGDQLSFSVDWLKEFMGGESRQTGPAQYDGLELAFYVDQLQFFVIQATFVSETTGDTRVETRETLDLVRIQYNSDLDRAWDQNRIAMDQLFESAQSAAREDNEAWSVILLQ